MFTTTVLGRSAAAGPARRAMVPATTPRNVRTLRMRSPPCADEGRPYALFVTVQSRSGLHRPRPADGTPAVTPALICALHTLTSADARRAPAFQAGDAGSTPVARSTR